MIISPASSRDHGFKRWSDAHKRPIDPTEFRGTEHRGSTQSRCRCCAACCRRAGTRTLARTRSGFIDPGVVLD